MFSCQGTRQFIGEYKENRTKRKWQESIPYTCTVQGGKINKSTEFV